MKIILLFILIINTSYAGERDCVRESIYFRLGFSLTDLLVSHAEHIAYEDKSDQEICKVDSEDIWRQEVKNLEKPHWEMEQELQSKGTVTGSKYFHSDEMGKFGPELNSQQICEVVDGMIKLNLSRFRTQDYMEKLIKSDLTGPRYEALCLKHLPELRQRARGEYSPISH